MNIVKAEVNTLQQTNDFNTINEKRGNIIESWLKKTRNNSSLEYEIRPNGEEGLKVNAKTIFKRSGDVWVQSEIYMYGIITDAGGATKPNIHITTEDNKNYTIDCKRDDIYKEERNRVFHPSGVRVLAKQNLYTGEIKEAVFAEFIDYNPIYNEEQLLQVIEKGRNAWSDVEDNVQWIRNLRTDD